MFPIRDTEPSYSKPVVTVVLIVINVLIFLFEASLDPYYRNAFIAAYGIVPDEFSFRSLVTSMFLHGGWMHVDRKSTRLNSSHVEISYAVFCLKKKKISKICNIAIKSHKHCDYS